MRKGYIQVYTGNSKGKTTAALGLAFRAAGAGMRVFIAQFIKKRRCSEHKALERFSDLITIKQYGSGFLKNPEAASKAAAMTKKGIEQIKKIVSLRKYDMLILDEINVAVHHKLINIEDIIELLKSKPPELEIILTGRYADNRIIEVADLVTEMREIKHYYKKGVKARKGIEL
jgi:cob(I)alamin adenosyltransferase